MPVEITMPQLSDTMEEGTLVKWLKKEGDKVKAGEMIAEVETDKANMEMEAFEGGTLAYAAAKEGDKVKVGEVIAVLATGKEDPKQIRQQFAGGGAKSKSAPAAEAPAPQQAPAERARPDHEEPIISVESEEHIHGDAASGHAPARNSAESSSRGPATATAVQAPPASRAHKGNRSEGDGNGRRIIASPLARRIAAERGIDLSQIEGTGPGGRIVKTDVESFQPAQVKPHEAAVPARREAAQGLEALGLAPTRVAVAQKQVIPLSKIRSVIAQRLQQSKQNIPHFYETIDIDVEELSKLRERVVKSMEKTGLRISIADFVAKAVATALTRHRELNATFDGKEITQYGDVNLGMAVALENGLIVPVLRGINHMGLAEIRVRSADLVERARAQKLKQDEMTGATFTVSNLGTFGVREFSAIINPPEVGILAIAAAEKRAVVRGEQIVARQMMTVTLSADHRVVDGATAAEFLRTLKGLLEEPGMMLV